jgi:hypothetical protein
VAGEAVDEVVLAAVRLVGDDHDVASVGERRVAVAPLLGQELLDRGEDDPASLAVLQQLPQVGAALRLDGLLPQELPAAGEDAEELAVQVVAVGEDHDGRVLHRRVTDDTSCVEHHRQALARTLRVPDDADATVPRLAAGSQACFVPAPLLSGTSLQHCRPQGLFHRRVYRVELVVARHFLGELPAAFIFEHDEVAEEPEEPPWLENASDEHF